MFEWFSTVKNGRLQKGVSTEISSTLQKFEGKRILVRIEKVGATRSIRQNSYLHALFDIFSKSMIEYTGDEQYDAKTLKNMVKTKFLMRDVFNSKTGEVTGQIVLKTRDLNKEDFAIFTEQVIRYAATEYNITLPIPEEQFEMDLNDETNQSI